MTDMSLAPRLDQSFAELSSPRPETLTGFAVAGSFFIGLLGWAALTPLDAGAVAPGVVAVSGNRQVVQHRDGGIVTALNVKEGQFVRLGDLLVTISATELVAAERAMTGEVLNLLAQRARLRAERDGQGQVASPEEFAGLDAKDAAIAAEALHGQRLLFAARRSALASERDVIRQQIGQHRAQIGGYTAQISSNLEQQRLIRDELAGLRSLEGRGFVTKTRIRQVERAAAELGGAHSAFRADIARASEGIGESRMQILTLDRRILEEAATQLREVQVRLDDVQPRLAASREQLRRAMIRATATGRVVNLKVHTVGGVVAPGETLMEIVPLDRALVIEAKASPEDADDIKTGMTTQVRFSALHEQRLPVLHGVVNRISADSLEDERTGARHFKIEVTVPPAELDKVRKLRGDNGIKAGIPAEVLIPLRKRTALGYLVDPLTRMFWLAGREN